MNFNLSVSETYQATQQCANWCLEQKVVAYHNLELQAVMIVAFTLLMMVAGDWAKEYPRTEKYAHHFYYFGKLSLYFFFYVFFFHIRGGI